ncbi:MAG: mucin9, partial [Acetobacteraceae bacterium]|nr:mucin9 [Acetobacteraceae bacterium]
VNDTVKATTTAVIGANATVHAVNDVTVDTLAVRLTDVTATGTSGGFVAPGGSIGTTVDTETTTGKISTGATVTSGQDVRVSAATQLMGSGSSSASGGGAATSGQSNTTVIITPITTVMVDKGASVTAVRDVNLTGLQLVSGSIADTASGGGVGASDHADGVFNIGFPGGFPLWVGANDQVTLSAGRDINASADYGGLNLSINNFASDSGIYAHPTTSATIQVNAAPVVNIGANDSVTATRQVNLKATLEGVKLSAITTTNKVGIGKQDPESLVLGPMGASVVVAAGATITTHGLEVDAIGGTPNVTSAAYEGGDFQDGNEVASVAPTRQIVFNGHAVLESGPAPYLVVNRFGQIVDHDGVSAVINGNGISVSNIVNTSPGWVHFVTDPGDAVVFPSPALPPNSSISGTKGSFTFVDTFQTVRLQNYSAMDMTVNNIDPVDRTPGAEIDITVDDTSGFKFTVANTFLPTAMNIGNYSTWNIGRLLVAGDIEDPIGDITLTSVAGSIAAIGNNEMVRGSDVTVQAGQNVGTAGQLFAVEIVESQQGPDFGLSAEAAAGNLNLSVRARLRDPSAFVFSPAISALVAGGDINLDLLAAVRDNTVLGPDYTTKVVNALPTFGGFSTSSQVDNDWPNDMGAGPPLPPGIFAIGSTPYNVTYTIGLLQAGGHINVTDPGSALVSLVANTNLTPGNSISVGVSGDVSLTELTGDLRVQTIAAGGAVNLTSKNGAILDTSLSGGVQPPAIKGQNITLTAINGNVGTFNNALDINLTGGATGLTVLSRNGINVLEVGGPLLLNSIDAGGDILLGTTAGSIKAASGAATPTVVGDNVGFVAQGGGIATAASPMTVYRTGALSIFAGAAGYVKDVPDNNLVEAGLGWSLGDGGTPNGKVRWGSSV